MYLIKMYLMCFHINCMPWLEFEKVTFVLLVPKVIAPKGCACVCVCEVHSYMVNFGYFLFSSYISMC